MKYIRTKDGKIYELQETKNGEKYLVRTGELIPLWNTEAYEILAQADKIEELGDCFIAVDKNGCLCEEPLVARGRGFKSFCNYYKANHMDVDCYLAILTDKGLIFVAKMNEEGKVELL